MPRAKTNEEYHKEVESISPNIEITGFYINGNSKMHCKCKICSYEWDSTARNLLSQKKCLGCFHKEKEFQYPYISDEEFNNIVSVYYPSLIVTGTYYYGLKMITCKCKDCGYISRIRVQKLLEHTYTCTICKNGKENIKYGINDIKTINPVLYDCLADKNIADRYTINSRAKTDFVCPSCGKLIKNKTIDKVNRLGLKCKCQDGNSLGEKYFFNIIKSVDENIKTEQYLNNNLSYRYDFVGVNNNISWICEIMGKQHYEKTFETCGGRTLKEEQENDKLKKEFALSCGICLYIEIDSKESGLNQLKDAILKSKLTDLYCFDDVDWVKCYKEALVSDVRRICDLWNNGYKVMEISKKRGFSKGKIRSCLIKGNSVDMCNYDHTKRNKIKVMCIDTGEVFNSLRDAEIKYNIKRGYLSAYLKGINLKVDNKHWKYIDEDTVIA